MRTTPETNNYIREVRPLQDDGCDYTATIIDRWNSAAQARSRVTATPPVKPVPINDAAKASGVVVKIGNRISYGKRVTMGIYQLHLSGKTDLEIARALCMSEDSVSHLLKFGTPSRKSLFMKCTAAPLPTEPEIMRRLAAESKA
ncbi:hypothetical protein JHW33_08525 [Rahnella aceris]|uniref:hypothetical protein n=1 Tax=Rahnella sp. (strain Y9602) TaxID=2703885 RepID=UPI001906A247|nr:hypothetical protein [Rahnella aceris]QQN36636.1 hypothetical protein JHW33_08525 [Rahnella aceris]